MDLNNHTTLLCTGARIPLVAAAATLFVLEGLLQQEPHDRWAVVKLREACLTDRPVPASAQARLREVGILEEDGTVPPHVREVVRAAVRGEQADVHVASPFVSPWDRTLADLIISKEKVRAALPPVEAEALITGQLDPDRKAEKPVAPWLNYLRKQQGPDAGFPPPSRN